MQSDVRFEQEFNLMYLYVVEIKSTVALNQQPELADQFAAEI